MFGIYYYSYVECILFNIRIIDTVNFGLEASITLIYVIYAYAALTLINN